MEERISGTTKTCCVIGNPVEHSLSPQIHNTLAVRRGDDMAYVALPVRENVAAAVRGLYEAGIYGINVTVPHKKAVMEAIVAIDPLAEEIGAVNTLKRVDGGYKGYNTDAIGLKRALARKGVTLGGKPVVLVGAGGAARAAAFLAAKEGAESLLISNRTLRNAEELAESVRKKYPTFAISTYTIDEAAEKMAPASVAIQCTSVGLSPNDAMHPVPEACFDAFYEKCAYCFDLIYRPEVTRFLAEGAKRGVAGENGLAMLVCQGVASYEFWFETEVSDEDTEFLINELAAVLRKQMQERREK